MKKNVLLCHGRPWHVTASCYTTSQSTIVYVKVYLLCYDESNITRHVCSIFYRYVILLFNILLIHIIEYIVEI